MNKSLLVGALIGLPIGILIGFIIPIDFPSILPSSYREVTVVEKQVSTVEFDEKIYTFVKEEDLLFITPWLSNGTNYVIPSAGSIYNWQGIEIAVSEVHPDYFVLLVKPLWE